MLTAAQTICINVANEFTRTPGGRHKDEGAFSGEEFLEMFLLPRFEQARKETASLLVDLDRTEGYATSFLEAAFGGLARRYSAKEVLRILQIKSDDEPYLIDEINSYVSDAQKS